MRQTRVRADRPMNLWFNNTMAVPNYLNPFLCTVIASQRACGLLVYLHEKAFLPSWCCIRRFQWVRGSVRRNKKWWWYCTWEQLAGGGRSLKLGPAHVQATPGQALCGLGSGGLGLLAPPAPAAALAGSRGGAGRGAQSLVHLEFFYKLITLSSSVVYVIPTLRAVQFRNSQHCLMSIYRNAIYPVPIAFPNHHY